MNESFRLQTRTRRSFGGGLASNPGAKRNKHANFAVRARKLVKRTHRQAGAYIRTDTRSRVINKTNWIKACSRVTP
jgi:hypothetical protein